MNGVIVGALIGFVIGVVASGLLACWFLEVVPEEPYEDWTDESNLMGL